MNAYITKSRENNREILLGDLDSYTDIMSDFLDK